jgi:hypothetical protein
MKRKIIICLTFTIVMLNALTLGANITDIPEYSGKHVGNVETTLLSQDTEYNISTYRDYAEATTNIMLSNLVNLATGEVFHAGSSDWTGDPLNTTTLSSYYWAISALSRAYSISNNDTYRIAMSRAARKMVSLFMDPTYPGFYVNQFSGVEIRQTKRAGVQAYAYWALDIAESTNSSLDFTVEKESALRCLTDILYDPISGGFFFYTMRNGSLSVPAYFDEVYPNDGKRLDHLVLGATVLFEAGLSLGNATLLNMADDAMSFMLSHMKYYHDMEFRGFKLSVKRTGGVVNVGELDRVAHSVVTDINAMAIRALVKGYETTGNTTYLSEANQLFETLFHNNWDEDSGGWWAEVVDGEPYDPLEDEDVKFYKYAEIQLQMILALEDLYETTESIYPIRMVIDCFELLIEHLWDLDGEGFVSNGNQLWETFAPDWQIHYTTVQAQAVIVLDRAWSYGLPIVTRIRITPTNPRPADIVYFSVTALDDDGIDTVFVNYSLAVGGNETRGILPLHSHPSIGGLYNNTMANFEDGSSINFEVFANDTTGRVFIAGIYHFGVRIDTFAPTAELRAIYPSDEVRVGDDVIIDMETFEFPEHSITNSCELWWRLNSGTYTIENMTLVGVDGNRLIWRYVLGQFHAGDVIAFFCYVTDESGNVGDSRVYRLTVLGPPINITPFSAFQIVATVGLIAAPGVGYAYTRMRKSDRGQAQREGKKAARKRARRRGPRRRS